jgi:anti-sigma factor RsiW
MSRHETEAIAGLLDGELRGLRRWRVVRHVRVCPLCASEYRRQRHVRRLLQTCPPDVRMSDSPEFFWSKVKGEIKRRGERRVNVPVPRLAWPDWLERHQFTVATAAAAVIAAVSVTWLMQASTRPRGISAAPVPASASLAQVEKLKTVIPNTTATAVESPDPQQVTVIWVSGLPWSPDMNKLKTEFANLDT